MQGKIVGQLAAADWTDQQQLRRFQLVAGHGRICIDNKLTLPFEVRQTAS